MNFAEAILHRFRVGAEGAMVQWRVGGCEEEVGVPHRTSEGTKGRVWTGVSHVGMEVFVNGLFAKKIRQSSKGGVDAASVQLGAQSYFTWTAWNYLYIDRRTPVQYKTL